MKAIRKESYSVWNDLVYLLKGIWDSDKKLMLMMVLETLCMVITPYIAMYMPKIGVDLVTEHADVRKVICILGCVMAALMLSQAMGNMALRGKDARQERLRSYYRILLFCKTLNCDYEHIESAKWQDKYNEAKEMSVNWGPWSATTLMSEGAIKVCGAMISFVLYGHIVGVLNPWILLLIILLSLLNFASLRIAQKYEMKRIMERSALQRRREYIKDCSSDVKYGKDIRLYEMSDWIRLCFRNYNDAHFRLRKDVQQRYFYAAFVEALKSGCGKIFLSDRLPVRW